MADEYVPSYATAVLPVFAWVQTNDWVDAFGAHVHEFYNGLVELFEEPANDVLEELPTPLWARAVRCCFDDFLTVEYEANPSNVLDHYIDEFGSGLESADADFLAAFRNFLNLCPSIQKKLGRIHWRWMLSISLAKQSFLKKLL